MSPAILQVVTTTETSDQARRLARQLVDARLAACVQIEGPIESIYAWMGKVETSAEYRLLVKTTGRLWPALRDHIQRVHAYDVPEIVATEVDHVSPAYANWLVAVLEESGAGEAGADPAVDFHLILKGHSASAAAEAVALPLFDETLPRLADQPNCHVEPDGSFTWRSTEGRNLLISGQLHDGREALDAIELHGSATEASLRALFERLLSDLPCPALQSLPTGELITWDELWGR
ncbi:MAG: divalent-cation tolerance protein CutA [Planctomycetales bacterium]|nr:divalent-cation tolerance protein CutA [Planctomycetales bacterium]